MEAMTAIPEVCLAMFAQVNGGCKQGFVTETHSSLRSEEAGLEDTTELRPVSRLSAALGTWVVCSVIPGPAQPSSSSQASLTQTVDPAEVT